MILQQQGGNTVQLNSFHRNDSGHCSTSYEQSDPTSFVLEAPTALEAGEAHAYLVKTMLLLRISGCYGNIVEQAESHGLVGGSMVARRPGNGIAGRHTPACCALS